MNQLKHLLYLNILIFASVSANAKIAPSHGLSVGQGISAPSASTTIGWSYGYTAENPVGLTYADGFKITGEYNHSSDSSGIGAEATYSSQDSWGIGGAYYQPDCNGCDSRAMGALGLNIANAIGFGMRFDDNIYDVGLIFNPKGNLRLGLMGHLNQVVSTAKVTSYGVGLAWVEPQWTFAVDASKSDYEDVALNDEPILLTPGLTLRAQQLQVSLNYSTLLNRPDGTKDVDNFWFGVGFDVSQFHLAFYSDYVNDISVALSLMF